MKEEWLDLRKLAVAFLDLLLPRWGEVGRAVKSLKIYPGTVFIAHPSFEPPKAHNDIFNNQNYICVPCNIEMFLLLGGT